ncbi:MAG: hypothetical protein R8G66_25060 [Cytophagales bacterium]|nr:hypothetical protein [Cytophagales bacterium]
MKRLFILLAALTLHLATQAQDKDKYEGLKKISPDRPKGSTTIIHLDDLDLADLDIDLSRLESLSSLSDLSSLKELSKLSALGELGELEELAELENLSELEELDELLDREFLGEIIEISLDASLKSLEALRELEIKPKKEQK